MLFGDVIIFFLVDEGEEDLSVLGVLLLEQLLVVRVLLVSPLDHLEHAHNIESDTGDSEASEDVETKPGHDLTEVVRGVNKLEEEAVGEDNCVPAFLAELREHNVADEVAEHRDDKPGHAEVHTPGRGLHAVCRDVDVPADEERCGVVVGAVLEQVEDRHGEGPELVDKDGLELALDVVDVPEDKGEALGEIEVHLCFIVVERGPEAQGEDGVDDEGPEVLDEVHGAEGDLGAEVLEDDLCLVLEAVLSKGLVAVGVEDNDVGLGPDGQTLARDAYLSLGVDGLLQVDHLLVTVDLHGGEGLEVALENLDLHSLSHFVYSVQFKLSLA